MPQVITGFDRFAQNQRQRKLDERTATLQDAQEARAVSAFEMAKQDRVTNRARQVKLDAQAEEAGKLRMQNDVLAVVAGASEQLMQTTSPMPLNGAFAPLTAYLPADLQQQAATVESVYGGDGNPSAFVYKDATGNTVATVGLQDPAAVAMMTGNIKQGSAGEWFAVGTTYDEKTGRWNYTQAEKGTGKTINTPVGTPAGAVDKTPEPTIAEQKGTRELAWQTVAPQIMDILPATLDGLVEKADYSDPIKAATTLRAMRANLALPQNASPEDMKEYQAAQKAIAEAFEMLKRFNGQPGSAPAAGALDIMGGGGSDPLGGVF